MPRTATLATRDARLLLEVPYRSFREMTAKNPNVLDAIAAMVKQRLVSNIAPTRCTDALRALYVAGRATTHLLRLHCLHLRRAR